MSIISSIMSKLQEERIKALKKDDDTYISNKIYTDAFIAGIERAEAIIFDEQQRCKKEAYSLWYTGSPNDLKPNNRGTYILIMRAEFDSEEDGIEKGKIYIDSDFWNGEEWESFEIGEGKWEVLYFTKLKWIKFPLPAELGIKKNDSLFFS